MASFVVGFWMTLVRNRTSFAVETAPATLTPQMDLQVGKSAGLTLRLLRTAIQ